MTDYASSGGADLQIVSTAIHAGHDLRSGVERHIALDHASRLREEDLANDQLTLSGGSVAVHRSRFEVDLNRSREKAVYRVPEDAWGLHVWFGDLPASELAQS